MLDIKLAPHHGCASNVATVPTKPRPERIATLWQLEWKSDRLTCTVYRRGDDLQMRLETKSAVIVDIPFELRPRTVARMRVLRDSLKRRGWHETR
jgi:hypothetical protein